MFFFEQIRSKKNYFGVFFWTSARSAEFFFEADSFFLNARSAEFFWRDSFFLNVIVFFEGAKSRFLKSSKRRHGSIALKSHELEDMTTEMVANVFFSPETAFLKTNRPRNGIFWTWFIYFFEHKSAEKRHFFWTWFNFFLNTNRPRSGIFFWTWFNFFLNEFGREAARVFFCIFFERFFRREAASFFLNMNQIL